MIPDWLAALGVAAVSASGAWAASRVGRVAKLERRVASLESVNRRLWLALRAEIDNAYRHKVQPVTTDLHLFDEEQ